MYYAKWQLLSMKLEQIAVEITLKQYIRLIPIFCQIAAVFHEI